MAKSLIRYAVVGLGHIAQVAVLPAIHHSKTSKLVALVSGNPSKLKKLSKKYRVSKTYSYEQYDECLKSGEIDAVYIALPNHLHREYAVRAAEAGIHVLCEKPLTVHPQDSEAIAASARKNRVKLMVAYRLHFDPAHLKAIKLIKSGKIGEPRYFTSEFGYELKKNNIRMLPEEGGGPLHDIGIYCINATRYLFGEEPTEVFAYADHAVKGVHMTVTAMMKFPHGKLAQFSCSFASGAISNLRVVGSKGDLFIDNAYEYEGKLKHTLTVEEKKKKWTSKPGDQFEAEVDYFSECISQDKAPTAGANEGLADVRIVEALYKSIKMGRPVKIEKTEIKTRPSVKQVLKRPAHREPRLVQVQAPSN